jgi:hypothetical protein
MSQNRKNLSRLTKVGAIYLSKEAHTSEPGFDNYEEIKLFWSIEVMQLKISYQIATKLIYAVGHFIISWSCMTLVRNCFVCGFFPSLYITLK